MFVLNWVYVWQGIAFKLCLVNTVYSISALIDYLTQNVRTRTAVSLRDCVSRSIANDWLSSDSTVWLQNTAEGKYRLAISHSLHFSLIPWLSIVLRSFMFYYLRLYGEWERKRERETQSDLISQSKCRE